MYTTKRLWLVALLLAGGLARGQSTVTLTGYIRNAGSMMAIEDFSEFQHIRRLAPDRVILPDSTGAFTVNFRLDAPGYFRIGRNVLYLTPGDKLNCELDEKFQTKAVFSGSGSEACSYLTGIPFPKAASYLEAGRYVKQDPVATMDSILMLARKRRADLAKLTGVTATFRRLEEARINYDILNSIHGVASYLFFMTQANNEAYVKTFRAISAPVEAYYSRDIADADMLQLEVYRDIIGDYIDKAAPGAAVQKIRDWESVYSLVKEMDTTGNRDSLKAVGKRLSRIAAAEYRKAGQDYLESLMHFRKGDYAIDVMCTDMRGKHVNLSSLRGKVIFVDLWATWCGPCMAEMPAYEALKAQFKDNPDVAFVSISIDDEANIRGWVKSVQDRKADGYQWQVNRNLLSAYNITGIPRTILIGKDFRVVEMNGPLPSAKGLPGEIHQLLGKS